MRNCNMFYDYEWENLLGRGYVLHAILLSSRDWRKAESLLYHCKAEKQFRRLSASR